MATPPVDDPAAADPSPKRRGRPPRNIELPGLETRAIQALEELAAEYADVRDRRMELNRENSN